MLSIYIDADACPVKTEIIKVAERHELEVYLVSNSGMRPLLNRRVHAVVVGAGADAADDWIAERIGADDIAITADILLAERCIQKGARVIQPNGHVFDAENIGAAVAGRSLSMHLRELGESTTNASFSKQHRAGFLQTLENTIQLIKRG